MDAGMLYIRCLAVIESTTRGIYALPCISTIGRYEYFFTALITRTIKGTGYNGIRVLRIHGYRSIPHGMIVIARDGFFRGDVLPLTGFAVKCPYTPVAHAPGTGVIPIRNIHHAIFSQHGMVGAVLLRMPRYGFPGFTTIHASEKILAVH